MEKYSPAITGKKTATTATTVSISGLVAVIIANKLYPILIANGIEIDQSLLIVGVTTAMQSGYTAITNWFKNRKKS